MNIRIVCKLKCALFTAYGLQIQYLIIHSTTRILDQCSHAAHFKEKLSCPKQDSDPQSPANMARALSTIQRRQLQCMPYIRTPHQTLYPHEF